MTSNELVSVAESHLGRFAFANRDNPFLGSVASVELQPRDRKLLIDLLDGELDVTDWLESQSGQNLVGKIQIGCVPREVQTTTSDGGSVAVNSVQAFLYAPVFWWTVSMLWTILIGTKIDRRLGDEICGYRLDGSFVENPGTNGTIFQPWNLGWKRWKDDFFDNVLAEHKGQTLAANTIDIRDFYYSVTAVPSEVRLVFQGATGRLRLASRDRAIEMLLDALHARFGELHAEADPRGIVRERGFNPIPLPVGPPSSPVLANAIMDLCLRELSENAEVKKVAAYVDDIAFVSSELYQPNDSPGGYLSRVGVASEGDPLLLKSNAGRSLAEMRINVTKAVISAGRSSHDASDSTDATDGTSDSSREDPYLEFGHSADHVGRLRTVLRAPHRRDRVNRELAKRVENLVTKIRIDAQAEPLVTELESVFEELDAGRFLELRTLWTQLSVATLALHGADGARRLNATFAGAASNLALPHGSTEKLASALSLGLRASWIHSLAQAVAVALSPEDRKALRESETPLVSRGDFGVEIPARGLVEYAGKLRRLGLIPPSYVAAPLAEFTTWTGRLIGPDAYSDFVTWSGSRLPGTGLDELASSIRRAARFIHLHEICLSVHVWVKLRDDDWKETAFSLFRSQQLLDSSDAEKMIAAAESALTPSPPTEDHAQVESAEPPPGQLLKIALPSIRVPDDQLKALINGDRVRSSYILQELVRGVNKTLVAAARNDADFLVLPEWSVPPEQLLSLAIRSSISQLTIVAGQTPRISGGVYHNNLWTFIPIQTDTGRHACVVPPPRVKHRPSPAERQIVRESALSFAMSTTDVSRYQAHGVIFASLVCFEFADIALREDLRMMIDLLTVSSLNSDWKYFNAIQDSATRDLYCFTVCVNTSHFPGSQLMRPTQSSLASIASVHGSEDPALVTRSVDFFPLMLARRTKTSPRELRPGNEETRDGIKWRDYKPLPPA